MKPAEKKITGTHRVLLAQAENQEQYLRITEEATDILDTDEDRVMDYYMMMNAPHEKHFMHA